MNLHLAFQAFLSYLDVEREKIAARRLEEIAKSENLDNFLVTENAEPGLIEYSTTHGFRVLCPDCFQHCPLGNRPQGNQFIITKKGNGFSKASNLPYIYLQTLCEPLQLIVEIPCVQAEAAGYATAVKLPYAIAQARPVTGFASIGDEYPEGTIIVCITEDNKESATFGYTNAVPLPYSPDSAYIQKIDMLDTEYAAMLVDEPRF